MIKQKIFLFFLISFFILLAKPNLFSQENLLVGISSQILNTRLMIDYKNPKTKSAYRPTSIVFGEYNFGKNYAIHTGFGYTMMTQNSDAFKNNFHYLAIPVYFKIGRIKEDRRFALSSFVGTNLHYLLKAQHISLDNTKTDITNQCQKFQFDFALGVGAKYKITDRYTLEALYSISIGSMINKSNAAYMDVNNLNSGFMLNLSYRFR